MTTAARNGLTLAAIAALCTLLVATTYQLTKARIAANEQAWLEKSLEPVLSGVSFEGSITMSTLVIEAPHELPGRDDAIVYRVYDDDTPVAALLAVTAPDGYSGPIRILVGISYDGIVTGVRVLSHRETPGLGDGIEASKSDWVYQFEGHALGDPPEAGWAIRRDGGQFDQLSGASVTPRAVIKAILRTLLYFEANREALFAPPAEDESE